MHHQSSERADAELLKILDVQGFWLVRGGRHQVLGPQCGSLRAALSQAHDFSMAGESPGPLVCMPDDQIRVPADQIWRLWQALGLANAA
jgi:hypothetical protein